MKTWKSNLEETKQRYINWWNHKGIILNMWEHFQEGDLGDQVFMAGCIDLFAEHHQQAGHQGKHRQQAEQNSLDQIGRAHV